MKGVTEEPGETYGKGFLVGVWVVVGRQRNDMTEGS